MKPSAKESSHLIAPSIFGPAPNSKVKLLAGQTAAHGQSDYRPFGLLIAGLTAMIGQSDRRPRPVRPPP